jgi:hypothetical protein
MGASGAVIALRDLEGLRCVASTGLAPARGTRLSIDLHLDSDFATACPNIGELAPCSWATTVPIRVQGTAIGAIEVYSSKPSTVLSNDIAALKQTAGALVPVLAAASVEGVRVFADLESRLFKELVGQDGNLDSDRTNGNSRRNFFEVRFDSSRDLQAAVTYQPCQSYSPEPENRSSHLLYE